MARDSHKAQIIQGGIQVAACEGGNLKQVVKELCHYVFMYSQDGPLKVIGSDKVMREFRQIRGSERYI